MTKTPHDRASINSAGENARQEGALAVAPGMELGGDPYVTADHRVPEEYLPVDRRTVLICALAILVAVGAGLTSRILVALIGLITNLAFFQRVSLAFSDPATAHLGLWVLVVPVIGALLVGVMARYGSAAIRGHGIPEVMEKVLHGESRIPARVMFLKPISAAVAIGTFQHSGIRSLEFT